MHIKQLFTCYDAISNITIYLDLKGHGLQIQAQSLSCQASRRLLFIQWIKLILLIEANNSLAYLLQKVISANELLASCVMY